MKIVQLTHQTGSQMMGYILIAPDGSISCMDGGMTGDAAHMLEMLKRIGGEKPRIKYWFLTHVHLDHCDAFLELYPRMGTDFELEHLVYTFPAAKDVSEYEKMYEDTAIAFEKIRPEHIEPKAGDIFQLGGGAQMRVLQTWIPEETANLVNNSSTVFQLESDGMKVIFLGDLGVEAGKRLLDTYGDDLRCHIVQMAHHGQNGVSRDVYEAMQPEMCLWNAPGWLWHNTIDPLQPGKGPWKTLEVRRWMEEIGAQRHVITRDGTWEIHLHDGQADLQRLEKNETDHL